MVNIDLISTVYCTIGESDIYEIRKLYKYHKVYKAHGTETLLKQYAVDNLNSVANSFNCNIKIDSIDVSDETQLYGDDEYSVNIIFKLISDEYPSKKLELLKTIVNVIKNDDDIEMDIELHRNEFKASPEIEAIMPMKKSGSCPREILLNFKERTAQYDEIYFQSNAVQPSTMKVTSTRKIFIIEEE